MKRFIVAFSICCLGLVVCAEEMETVLWMVGKDSSPGIKEYDGTCFYAQLGEGDVITLLGASGEYDVIEAGYDSDSFESRNLLTLDGDRSQYSFWFELLSGGDVVGKSAQLSYEQLVLSRYQSDSGLPQRNLMTPTFSAIPEPTSGLLLLLGVAGLALRRKRVA